MDFQRLEFLPLPRRTIKPLFVLIDGLDDLESNNDASTAKHDSILTKSISDCWPDAKIRVFDFFDKNAPLRHVNHGYLFQRAQNIIRQLNRSDEAPLGTHADPVPVVFLAHTTGAALVQRILLLALQDPSTQWLAIWAVAAHFVDSPVHYEQATWENYVVRLLGNIKMDFWHLSGIFEGLPTALSQIKLEFSLISDAFNVQYHNTQQSDANANSRAFWGFHEDQAEYLDMLSSIHRVVHEGWWGEFEDTRQPFWKSFHQRYIAVPQATLGWLTPDRQLHEILGSSLNRANSDLSSWRESPKSEILLVTGSPGSGAKRLACWAITTLRPEPRADEADILTLSYDFDCQDTTRNTERSLLASLIQQIIILRPDSGQHIQAHLENLCESNMPYIPCTLLWSLLKTLLQAVRAHRIFLVIHAVDQCLEVEPRAPPKKPPQTVARKLADLSLTCQESFKHVKILMTSSGFLDLGRETHTRQFDLGSNDCKDIVRRIVRGKVSAVISQVPAWREFEQEILGKVCAKEHTHLQTMLNLNILEQSTIPATKEAIHSWLSNPLPFSAASLQFEVRDVPSARNILSWVSYAVRPLTIRELSVAVALQSLALDGHKIGNTSLESLEAKVSSNLTRDIESAVKVLINIGDNQHVTLAHHTLRKSLESEGTFLWPEQHASIAGQCLLYMSLCSQHNDEDVTSAPAGAALDNVTALLAYSQRYWTQHYALAQSPNDDLDQQVLDFLTSGSQSPALTSWAKTYQIISGKTQPEEISVDDPLLLAIQLGFGRVVRLILGREDVQQQPERLDKALMFSAKSLPLTSDIMGDLLPHISSSHDFGPALRSAAAYGNTDCVELLVDRIGGSWDNFLKSVEGKRDQDPILLAASGGHTSTVELLIKRGCSILRKDMKEGIEATTLHLAAKLGDAETLSTMRELQKDDFNMGQRWKLWVHNNGPWGNLTPLGLGCRIGSFSVIDILLKDEEQRSLSSRPGHDSPLSELSAEKILVDITSTGNLAMFRRLSIVDRYPFHRLCHANTKWGNLNEGPLNQWYLLGRIASTEVIKFLVEKEQQSIDGAAATTDQDDRHSKAFDNQIKLCMGYALECMNNELVISLSEKMDKPMWDEWIEKSVLDGNLPLLEYFLNHGTPVNDTLSTKSGVMTWVKNMERAVRRDHVDVLRYLANIMKRAKNSASQHLEPRKPELVYLFILAAQRGHTFCLRELFRLLFIPFDLSGAWSMLLETAVAEGTLTSLNDVLKWKPEGYKPSVSIGVETTRKALRTKDGEGRLERVRLLLANGILASSLAGKGRTSPLHVAVEPPWDINVVELLLKAGVSPNLERQPLEGPSETPLHIVVWGWRKDIFRLLLQHGGDPNLYNGRGENVLHMAAECGSTEELSLLLGPWIQDERREEDLDRSMSMRRRSPWRRHGVPHPTRDLPTTENLKRPSVDAKTSDKHGQTPLILAAGRGRIEAMRMLLLAGADPNLQDSDMCTPLHAAIWNESLESVKLLIDHDADVNITTNHPLGSPLNFLVRMYPGEEFFSKTADLLLQKKANVNAQDSSGFTPLMRYLGQYRNPLMRFYTAPPNVLEKFIETSLHLTNCLGKTALHYAAYYPGTFDVIKMLLEARANPLARDNLGHTPLYYSLLSVERDLMRNSTAWSDRVQTLMGAISPEDRQCALSEAILAAVKTGLEVRLDMVLNEKEECLNLLLDIPDNSGYQALDIAYSFGKEYETATQKIIALGGKTGSDDKKKSPTRWNKDDRSEHLRVWKNGMDVSFEVQHRMRPYRMMCLGGVRADHPIPTNKRMFYFEVQPMIYSPEHNWLSAVAIGFQTEQCTLRGLTGWERGSWGYHSDDGKVYNFSEPVHTYGKDATPAAPYRWKDVIGVFVDPPLQRARFRKNNQWVGDWFYGVVGQLYPTASFYCTADTVGVKLRINFGNGAKGKTGRFKYPPKKEDWEDGTPEAEDDQEEKQKQKDDEEDDDDDEEEEEDVDEEDDEEDDEEEEDDVDSD